MRRISIYVLSLMLSGAFFVACEKDESNKLTFDKDSVEAIVGEEAVVKVSGGEAPYKATPADKTIVEATVEGSDVTVKALKEGNTTVKVTDKNGLEATIAVTVKKDPYAEDKEDATVRIKWDTYGKVEGTDAGVYKLTKAENKTVTFSWTNEEKNESIVLTFRDVADQIGGDKDETKSSLVKSTSQAPVGELIITMGEGEKKYGVASLKVVQAQPADDGEGTPDTYWIGFTADGKSGICVAPLTVETE